MGVPTWILKYGCDGGLLADAVDGHHMPLSDGTAVVLARDYASIRGACAEVKQLRAALTDLRPLLEKLDRQRGPVVVPDWISLAIEEAAFIVGAALAGKPTHPNRTAAETLEYIEKLHNNDKGISHV